MFCNRSPNLSVTFENTLNNILSVDDVNDNDMSDDNDNDDDDYGDDNKTSF